MASSAQAIVIKRVLVQEIADPTFRYDFEVDLEADCTLKAGDFFTIYDMIDIANVPPDTLHSSSTPTNWILSTPAIGATPGGVTVTDSSTKLNLTWTYFGPTLTLPGPLGIFSAAIEQPVWLDIPLTYTFTCSGMPGPPNGQTVTPQYVPEPASFVTLACGLSLLGFVGLRKRRGA